MFVASLSWTLCLCFTEMWQMLGVIGIMWCNPKGGSCQGVLCYPSSRRFNFNLQQTFVMIGPVWVSLIAHSINYMTYKAVSFKDLGGCALIVCSCTCKTTGLIVQHTVVLIQREVFVDASVLEECAPLQWARVFHGFTHYTIHTWPRLMWWLIVAAS